MHFVFFYENNSMLTVGVWSQIPYNLIVKSHFGRSTWVSNLTGRMVCCITKASPPQVHSLTFFNLIFIYILWGSFTFYLMTHSTHFILWLYGIGHMVEDHSDSERGNPLPPHGLHDSPTWATWFPHMGYMIPPHGLHDSPTWATWFPHMGYMIPPHGLHDSRSYTSLSVSFC